MCGIVGYTGKANGRDYLLEGLRNLEYRGYDSAGIGFFLQGGRLQNIKTVGKLQTLAQRYVPATEHVHITTGIGHTRWATHGVPSEQNAHPIASYNGRFLVVHNGIIENYFSFKTSLLEQGIPFHSQTDTEVFANLLAFEFSDEPDIFGALPAWVNRTLEGSFAVLILDQQNPDIILCVRRNNPMCIGKSAQNDIYIASDPNAMAGYVDQYAIIPDYTCLKIHAQEIIAIDFTRGEPVDLSLSPFTLQANQTDKGDYEHFMLKEIKEQPSVLRSFFAQSTTDGSQSGQVDLSLRAETITKLKNARSVYFIGCGTSFHAAKFGEYVFEQIGLQTFSESGGEFKCRSVDAYPDVVYIFLSQSGEAADILSTVQDLKEKGGFCVGVTNVLSSSLYGLVDDTILMKAGPEVSVASTKAFTVQLLIIILLAQQTARLRGRALADQDILLNQLAHFDQYITDHVFSQIDRIRAVAHEKVAVHSPILYIGRNVNYPIALEGALKLKEISYIGCHGMPMGELKHGTLALIDEKSVTFAVASRPHYQDKFISNVHEILSRHGQVIIIRSDKVRALKHERVIDFHYPNQHDLLNTIVNAIFLQLFAYYTALCFSVDIDRPRNLAKSVTVE